MPGRPLPEVTHVVWCPQHQVIADERCLVACVEALEKRRIGDCRECSHPRDEHGDLGCNSCQCPTYAEGYPNEILETAP